MKEKLYTLDELKEAFIDGVINGQGSYGEMETAETLWKEYIGEYEEE